MPTATYLPERSTAKPQSDQSTYQKENSVMKNGRSFTVLAIAVCIFLAMPSIVRANDSLVELGTTPAKTGANKVMAAISPEDGTLVDIGSGEPAVLPPLDERIPVSGGEVFWLPKRDWVDDLGYRHIHYKQRFLYTGPLADLLPEPYSTEGIPFSGGSLKLHYDQEGYLHFVSGAYFDSPQTPSDVLLRTPIASIHRAWQALEEAGFEMPRIGDVDGATLEKLLNLTKPKLASSGDGRAFSLVWDVPVLLANGNSLKAALDGASGELIRHWDPNPHSNYGCDPTSTTGSTAGAEPQNSAIPDRTSLAATVKTGLGTFPYEANWPESLGTEVKIVGFRGTGATDSCAAETGNQFFEVVPVRRVGASPKYTWEWSILLGQWVISDQAIAGDAMWKTKLTMDVFEELGWDSYDNQGSVARIVTESNCLAANIGQAVFVVGPTTYAPIESVMICPKDSSVQDYSSAASLDVLAHEWGHGVVYENAWGYGDMWEKQLCEGWADVIGHSVEWREEPSGSGPETRDWKFDEDARPLGEYARKVNFDDGVFVDNPDPDLVENPYSYHAEDEGWEDYGHYVGMRLAVAYWLAADGETDPPVSSDDDNKNPVCQRSSGIPANVDCNLEVTPIGSWKATQVFFRMLTVYIDDTDEWDDFAQYAKHAAINLFGSSSPCDNADFEQDSMQDAFTAIGYPGPTPTWRYCSAYPACCAS